MALSPGSRLGAYEILAAIGVGGMGEVYRARDTKLNRDVALKVLPDAFTVDGDRIARFRREAQVLASLNHPNIAAIYGFEDSSSTHALVLELVEGPTLADRIAKGPIPLDEALPIARQIAEALEAAHEQGIVHRDLKPANIKVRDDGTVKVLDFGLAKLADPAGAALQAGPNVNVTASPTITSPAMMTGVGVILGTAAYMSPEQAKGRPADKRSDVWAFGCVLYEMLTGKRAFEGEDVSDTLAAVLRAEPNWALLPADLAPAMTSLVRRCLEKDRRRRLAEMSIVLFVIDEPGMVGAPIVPVAVTPAAPRQPAWTRAVPFALTAILAGAVIGGVLTWGATRLGVRSDSPQPVRFAIVPPTAQPLTLQGFQRDIAITPDGRNIVYRVGSAGTQGSQLAVRSLDQLDARVLPGIRSIRSPFISPDGRWIGFFEGAAGGELKKVSILGGPPITLCRFTGNPLEASWGPDGTIIFADSDRSTGLLSVNADGGEPKMLTKPDVSHGELDHAMPFILPGGRAVLFTILALGQSTGGAQVAALDLKTGQKKVLIRGGADARYVDTGHLVYAADGTLRAVRFDLDRLEVTSDPVPVAEKVAMSATTWTANFVLSNTGTLVYVPGGVGGGFGRALVWVSREGHEEAIKAPLRIYALPRISPDGTRVALDIRDQENDIWAWDLARETLTRVTFDPGLDQDPVWTPDSRRLVFSSLRSGAQNLYAQAADNTGTIERLTTSPNPQFSTSMSPDGTHVLFMESTSKTGQDIHMLTLGPGPATASRPTQPLLQTAFNETNAEVSPDGRWVAYQSNESGTIEVYVRPFPKVDAGRWQVSTGGGAKPLWARNGRELFYDAFNDGAFMAVTVRPAGAIFSASTPSKLFDTAQYYLANSGRSYDVSADGRRFLMIKLASTSGQRGGAPSPSLVVVERWVEELKQRVPTK